ncbi:MAG: HEPN domain-containing protein [Planctomycetes bacterium]|nr:HEPN domain-containing protein [Planctomycetota bacterium]
MSTPVPEQWADRARYDLETARAMLDSGRLLYVLFCCQQAIEKMLKGVIAARTGELPPRLHNLMQLAKHVGLEPEANRARLMRELSEYYFQSRYPDTMEAAFSDVSAETAGEALDQTEAVVQWLSSML